MIFFTSDLHFWHRNIIQYCNRPFASVEEMNEGIISNWNSRVSPTDTVYVIGDVSFGEASETHQVLLRLNGFKHLIIGNHDRHGRHSRKHPFPWDQHFLSQHDYLRLKTGGHKFVLCHFPFASWERGYVNLHGHTHGKYPSLYGQHDVGVDSNNFFPITVEEAVHHAFAGGKQKPDY